MYSYSGIRSIERTLNMVVLSTSAQDKVNMMRLCVLFLAVLSVCSIAV